eukprot:TRINITY_DN111476_c0_g1_i1.p1 TRINITY_DN111476_c0_g1~~TRINITY_DN111476_c0_g1_i1.p1  ORF type:complete len:394 (+),score=99.83 TRINITY_DN111476_c0_g1_i1:101-1282(+)
MKRKSEDAVSTQESITAAVDVLVIGCGEPKKAMGWYHLTQILESPMFKVVAVVEPWYLGPGTDAPGSDRFAQFRTEHPSLTFYSSVAEVPERKSGALLAVISVRTLDAPIIFGEALSKGATHVYLEKPGAQTAAELREMQAAAKRQGVEVLIGYNKNVSEYALQAMGELRRLAGKFKPERPAVTLQHFNAFARDEELWSFLRGPGGEGMVHNMCCHELAMAVVLFGASMRRLKRVRLDREESELVDLGDGHEDWVRLSFMLELQGEGTGVSGVCLNELRFCIDRCAGNVSLIRLVGPGQEVAEFRLPTAEHQKWVEQEELKDSEIRKYFLQQAPDYRSQKLRFAEHISAGKKGLPEGVVSIADAVEVLELADFLAKALKDCWHTSQDWEEGRS